VADLGPGRELYESGLQVKPYVSARGWDQEIDPNGPTICMAVSRFFCFPIQMNFAENQKWPGKRSRRAGGRGAAGPPMKSAPRAGRASRLRSRVGKKRIPVKRRGVAVPQWMERVFRRVVRAAGNYSDRWGAVDIATAVCGALGRLLQWTPGAMGVPSVVGGPLWEILQWTVDHHGNSFSGHRALWESLQWLVERWGACCSGHRPL
jgi:hypothetical protein